MFFFFKQKTAYDMRISDWSSDVCSSDLPRLVLGQPAGGQRRHDGALVGVIAIDRGAGEAGLGGDILDAADRKSVVWGKSVSVRVDLGGRWIIQKKLSRTILPNTVLTQHPITSSSHNSIIRSIHRN